MSRKGLAITACIGDEKEGPTLHLFGLDDTQRRSIALPGRPRWCATDAAAEGLFLAIREPSMILVTALSELNLIAQWKLPSGWCTSQSASRGLSKRSIREVAEEPSP